MSAILGIFAPDARPVSDARVRAMLDTMRARGADHSQIWHGPGATLAVARYEWERTPAFSGSALVVEDGRLVVAADASVYYREDLRRKLDAAGVRPGGDTASHLVLAAYRAWGAGCPSVIEGDFAFIVYDRDARTVFCARDYAGRHPLYYAEPNGALVVASTTSAVLAHPDCPEEINLGAVGVVAAGFLGMMRETAYRGVFTLPAGDSLRWTPANGARTETHWEPPVFESGSKVRFDEAAEELRVLLGRATAERFADDGPTSIWMSGGWDSTAIFAAGEQVLRERGSSRHLEVISISYPPGDPGREDELILDIAGRWNRPVNWLDIRDIPLFDQPIERAAAREEPLAHVYEMWNRALIGASQRLGAHVALDGFGGDGLFQVSPIFLADLLRTGRWPTLVREWRAKQIPFQKTTAFKLLVQPLLPPVALRAVAALRGGRPLRGHIERVIPHWIHPDFVARYDLKALAKSPVRRRRGESIAATETQWHLRTPWVPTILSALSSMGLEQGVEIRSPLYDRRVIEFAATRPRDERTQLLETKRLLRASMRGLLPDHVLAPRKTRTGMTRAYLARSLRDGLPGLLDAVLDDSVLAEHGVIDPTQLRWAAERYLRAPDGGDTSVVLFLTLQAELWARARLRPGAAATEYQGSPSSAVTA